jgi:iron complex transport system ATP-binding protein
MLSLHNIGAGYGGELVLQDVTVEIAAGEFVGVIGPNGCGKTTLLRVISGVLPFRTGDLRLQEWNLREISRRKLARIIAHLPQDLSVDLAFTVREVVMMGRSPHLPRFGRETQRDLAIAHQAMGVTRVSHLADRPITELSGGERQRVFIAMCLAQEPEVLLLDEPNSHLDMGHQLSILDLIGKLNRQNHMTVVAAFHDLNLAAEYCHRLVVLDRGRVVAQGAPHEVLTRDMLRQVYGVVVLIQRNPLSGKPHVICASDGNWGREAMPHNS